MCEINAAKKGQVCANQTNEGISHVHRKNDKFSQEERRSAPSNVPKTNSYGKEDETATLSSRLMCLWYSWKNL